jgi:hypothetical protein
VPIDRSRIRPSLAWLGLAALPIVAGIAGATLLVIDAVDDVDKPFSQIDGPTDVRLDEHEGRGIWARTEAEVSGFCSATGPAQADMKPTHGVTVTTGGHEYHSFLRFRAPRAGRYQVDCATSRPLWLGPYLTGGRIVGAIGGVLGSFFGGLLLGGLIVGLVLLARERSTRRLELEAQAFK